MVIRMPFAPLASARARRVVGVLAAGGALALVLVGCTGAPSATPTPAPTETAAEPIFASDEEALAALSASYSDFLAVATTVTNDGGADPERLDSVAAGQALAEEAAAAQRFADDGLRTIGSTGFRVEELQSVEVDPSRGTVVTAYVCDDLRGLDLINSSGTSLVVEGRVVDIPYTVVVEGTTVDDLKVSEKQLWQRENFCQS